MFTKVMQENTARSKEKIIIIAACIYLACRLEGYPRLLEEISSWCFVPVDEVTRMQSKLSRRLEITCPMIMPKDLVNRFVSYIPTWPTNFTPTRMALDICQSIEQYELFSSMTPQQIAAGVILWVALLQRIANMDLERLCYISYISMAQLKAFYQMSHKMIANLVPQDLIYACEDMSKYPVVLEKCCQPGTSILKSYLDEKKVEEAVGAVEPEINPESSQVSILPTTHRLTPAVFTSKSTSNMLRKRKTISLTPSPKTIKEEDKADHEVNDNQKLAKQARLEG